MYNNDCILIKDIRPGLRNINVQFIVLEIGNATVTKENKEVRTFKVADQSACINVSIWGEPGNLLFPGDIVRLTKGYAVIWRQCLTLYSGKSGDIHKIGDFCMLFNEQLNMSEPNPNFGPQQQQGAATNASTAGDGVNNGLPNNGGGSVIVNGGGNGRGAGPSGGFNGNTNSNSTPPTAIPPKTTRLSNENKGGGTISGGPAPGQKNNRSGRSK